MAEMNRTRLNEIAKRVSKYRRWNDVVGSLGAHEVVDLLALVDELAGALGVAVAAIDPANPPLPASARVKLSANLRVLLARLEPKP